MTITISTIDERQTLVWPTNGDLVHGEEVEPRSEAGKRVSEEEYWERYYEFSDIHYEWNDGILEEKPVADYRNTVLYRWFMLLLDAFLASHPVGKLVHLEMGFRLQLPHKATIRKPDMFVIRNDNPVDLGDLEHTYRGVCDLAIESLSDTTRGEVERDTVQKKEEYEAFGIPEYYILDASGERTAFYRLTPDGDYVEMSVGADNVIRSLALPGFQFRLADLERQPRLIELAVDPLYSGYVLPEYVAERERAQQAELAAEFERLRAEEALLEAAQERQRAEEEHQRAEHYAAMLRAAGLLE